VKVRVQGHYDSLSAALLIPISPRCIHSYPRPRRWVAASRGTP
jgi:hypothetical protein